MSKVSKRPFSEVLPIAQHIVDSLSPFCERIELAGSLRRKRPMVGDIEIVAIPYRPRKPQLSLLEPAQIDWKKPTELDGFLQEKSG